MTITTPDMAVSPNPACRWCLSAAFLTASRKEFDAEEAARQLVEGQLNKYTNVVKGWQFRWFVLNPARGTLEYYMPEEKRKTHPRGAVHLAGCVVSPSEDDSQTFIVHAACGDVYKLKAADARERQFWVDKIRLVVAAQESRIAEANPPLPLLSSSSSSGSKRRHQQLDPTASAPVQAVREHLMAAQKLQRSLVEDVEKLTATDPLLLGIKATSQAMVMSLEQSFAILQSVTNR